MFASAHRCAPSKSIKLKLLLALFVLLSAGCLLAETISGTVQDPTGAVIPGARIEITGANLAQPVVLTSDGLGKFQSLDLKPGTYTVKVVKDGFKPEEKTVELRGPVQLQLTMSIAQQITNVQVPGKSGFANSDSVYRQLREIGLGNTYEVEDFTLTADVGVFRFDKGTMTMLAPVNGVVTGAIFVGEGHFNLKPAIRLDARELVRRAGSDEVNEDFTEVVFRFTRGVYPNFENGHKAQTETPAQASTVFDHWREKMRERHEEPRSLTEALLTGETMDNVDADVLAAIYNPAHPLFLNAYIHGKKHKDLRFLLRTRVGALPQFDSPEEVGLVNYDPDGAIGGEDGVWYLSHLKPEWEKSTASSLEERRLFATHDYKIETVIAKNGHLFATAKVTFEPLVAGERVLKFGLLPNLRVTRVADDQGQDLYYVQEGRKQDGSFYVILPEAPPLGKTASITIEYAGDKVLEEAGQGSYYVAARTSWYPNLNGFGEKSLYDLTFKVPKNYKLISVGELKSESVEEGIAVTHWVTPVPVAVAGFNYGQYDRMDLPADDKTGYKISGYYLTELPDNLRRYDIMKTMAPRSMTKFALEQTRAQLQICNYYFGKSPYSEIYITEQPNFNFGQSWPYLVYLPISAYTDSTQRWMLFGNINTKFTGFVQEVTPHEVSHQWWGHAVSWASYHDQWLSEGFAEFSAGLFLQQAVGGDWRKDYIEFWERLRQRILEKNNFGLAPNDAGPLWMGLRLNAPKTASGYQNVVYPKGAYVLGMLRSMMYNPEDHDKAFIDMMHDFVGSHRDHPASTESFIATVQKHMTKSMDLAGNGRIDWFFDEWVYGTQIPKYSFQYQVAPSLEGKVKAHITVTQSEVDDHFMMSVPVYGDFGRGMVRVAQVRMVGNSTGSFDLNLPEKPKKLALNAYKEILER